LAEANAWSDNPVSAFDFALRYRLKDLCQQPGFSLRRLAEPGTLLHAQPSLAVTFVENHDVARSDPIISSKMLAYAFILTHQGYPCVFWQDYYTWSLARPGRPDGIDALVRVHEEHAGGDGSVLHVDDDLYLMQRSGHDPQRGLVFALNNRASWNGAWVKTRWASTRLSPAAWGGEDSGTPEGETSNGEGWAELWAPPRGYAVFVPES
jgi:alpha-amylase